jgi:hypothetical protein
MALFPSGNEQPFAADHTDLPAVRSTVLSQSFRHQRIGQVVHFRAIVPAQAALANQRNPSDQDDCIEIRVRVVRAVRMALDSADLPRTFLKMKMCRMATDSSNRLDGRLGKGDRA